MTLISKFQRDQLSFPMDGLVKDYYQNLLVIMSWHNVSEKNYITVFSGK